MWYVWWREEVLIGIWWGKLEEKRPLGRRRHKMILKWIFKYCDGVGVGWIYLARDRGRWRTVVNTVMNLRVQSKTRGFLTS
jgi:hypothetical protein